MRVQGYKRANGLVPVYEAREDRIGDFRWKLVGDFAPDSPELVGVPFDEHVKGGAHVSATHAERASGLQSPVAFDWMRDHA